MYTSSRKALWKRMDRMKNGKPFTVKEAWNNMKKLTPGTRNEQKHKAFMLWLKDPDSEDWCQHVVNVTESFTKSHKQTITKSKFYKGELIQKHGRREALDFIAKGKYKATQDEDGDEIFVVTQAHEEMSRERSSTASATKYHQNKQLR